MNSLLFGITATDPTSAAGAIIVLVTAGALGAWILARHASKVDPIGALRYD